MNDLLKNIRPSEVVKLLDTLKAERSSAGNEGFINVNLKEIYNGGKK